jgi:hypothetical protein
MSKLLMIETLRMSGSAGWLAWKACWRLWRARGRAFWLWTQVDDRTIPLGQDALSSRSPDCGRQDDGDCLLRAVRGADLGPTLLSIGCGVTEGSVGQVCQGPGVGADVHEVCWPGCCLDPHRPELRDTDVLADSVGAFPDALQDSVELLAHANGPLVLLLSVLFDEGEARSNLWRQKLVVGF